MKLTDLLKDIELGKVYTDKDRKPFKVNEEKEGKMAKHDAMECASDSKDVSSMIQDETDLPEWLEAKITISKENMNAVKDYLTHHTDLGNMKEGLGSALLPTWKIFIKGYKKPFRVAAMDSRDAKRVAHEMMRNNKVKIQKVVKEGKLNEGINVRKWIKAVDKGEDVVVYDKKGKRYNLQGGDNKSVQVTDHWEDAGRRNVHPESTWQTLPLSKVKKIVKEEKLSEKFDIKTPGYSSGEAKTVVDGALKQYSKDLRKLQGRVVKDWMSKAKSGVIDYFDLVRGFSQGDAKRAYPYETDFLLKVLSKDKIIDRFRKYFGGKKGKKR